MVEIGSEIVVTIEGLAQSGAGVGFYHTDTRRAVFVDGTVPGDMVRVCIRAQRKAYFEGDLIEVMTPSAHRRVPVCKHFGVCGGCDWLHVDYSEQLRQKERLLAYAFSRKGMTLPSIRVIPSVTEYWYRGKTRFTQGGFLSKRSHTVIPIEECFLIDKRFSALLATRPHGSFGIDEPSGRVVRGDARYVVNNESLHYHPSSFVQSNFATNRLLVDEVAQQSGDVLELYAGNGNFTLAIAKNAKSVTAVEGDEKSFALLLRNIKESGASNIESVLADVRRFVRRHTKRYDTVVLDPPRAGMGRDIEKLSHLTDRIIYISCDASSLVDDIRSLAGFVCDDLVLIDMFPQTRHFETVAVLVKKDDASRK